MPREHVYAETVTVHDGALDDESPTPTRRREVRLRVTVDWTPDGRWVTLGVTGEDPATGDDVPLPGYHVSLDWVAANQLLRVVRVARDAASGTPE